MELQIFIELVEQRDLVAARLILRQTPPMITMKNKHPERYTHLDSLLSRPYFDSREVSFV